jgi:hypothetical protein
MVPTSATVSSLSVVGTGLAVGKYAVKAIAAPTIGTKIFYGLSCASYDVSLSGFSVCLVTRYNPVLLIATLGSRAVGFAAYPLGR